MRAYKKAGRPPCKIEGCPQPLYCRGMCVTHYTRWRRDGVPGPAARERGIHGAGSVNEDGYRQLHMPGHPLARAQGVVLEHRVVLFGAIGDGTHPCHWCGVELTWVGRPSRRICVDHLDDNRLNNDRSNLVPSCLDCNTKRAAA